MTPQALATVRALRTLDLPAATWRKVAIGMDGRPDFSALTDAEFDALAREVRRKYPLVDLAQQGWG